MRVDGEHGSDRRGKRGPTGEHGGCNICFTFVNTICGPECTVNGCWCQSNTRSEIRSSRAKAAVQVSTSSIRSNDSTSRCRVKRSVE